MPGPPRNLLRRSGAAHLADSEYSQDVIKAGETEPVEPFTVGDESLLIGRESLVIAKRGFYLALCGTILGTALAVPQTLFDLLPQLAPASSGTPDAAPSDSVSDSPAQENIDDNEFSRIYMLQTRDSTISFGSTLAEGECRRGSVDLDAWEVNEPWDVQEVGQGFQGPPGHDLVWRVCGPGTYRGNSIFTHGTEAVSSIPLESTYDPGRCYRHARESGEDYGAITVPDGSWGILGGGTYGGPKPGEGMCILTHDGHLASVTLESWDLSSLADASVNLRITVWEL